jgi:hypothetical protein
MDNPRPNRRIDGQTIARDVCVATLLLGLVAGLLAPGSRDPVAWLTVVAAAFAVCCVAWLLTGAWREE